jgi:ABC-2 type transport system permease protein
MTPEETAMTALFAVPALYRRRLTLTVRTPRELLVPLVTPVLFAVIIAPALASIIAAPGARTAYMTFVALATAGLLIPLNTMFSGIGVIVDRQQGAQRELLVAPIGRTSIVLGNLLAAVSITALQLAVLIACAELRGATFVYGRRLAWFVAAALVFAMMMYGVAELMANRLPSPEAYIGAVPAVAIVPWFLAGTLYPITALPHWLTYIARALPLTHALALLRYGLTNGGGTALHNIWGMTNTTVMAALSLAVVCGYAAVAAAAAMRVFARRGVQ